MKDANTSAFFAYYERMFVEHDYGVSWNEVLTELERDTKPILRVRPDHKNDVTAYCKDRNITLEPLKEYDLAFLWPKELPYGEKLPEEIQNYCYVQNASSLHPVLALDVQANDKIWDACAAPGGKSSFIAELLHNTGQLLATDASSKRTSRLRDVLGIYRNNATTVSTTKAEILFKQHPEAFDKILLDVPCSSEKHVLHSEKHLAEWTPARTKQLAFRQHALLSGVWRALKPGGRLVYATCALSVLENEAAVEKFIKKTKKKFGESSIALINQKRILPHQETIAPGSMVDYDPMFFAVLTKQ